MILLNPLYGKLSIESSFREKSISYEICFWGLLPVFPCKPSASAVPCWFSVRNCFCFISPVRNIRRDANDLLKKLEKGGEITEDELADGEDQIQKLTDKMIAKVDKAVEEKTAEIMTV